MKEIPLTRGMVAVVDDEDHDWLNQWNWHVVGCSRGKYKAVRSGKMINSHRPAIYMHREIMHTPEGMDTDHINHDGLDNRKGNLRNCTRSQNSQNQLRHKPGESSIFKGVTRYKATKWQAHIRIDTGLVHLGVFDREEDAAKEYDLAASHHFRDFALTNSPVDPQKVAGWVRKQRIEHSRFRGVTWNISKEEWQAGIGFGGRSHTLGYFKPDIRRAAGFEYDMGEVKAALLYDTMAIQHIGKITRPNFLVV